MLVPPQKFGMVEGGVYRCLEVLPLNLGFLSTLGLNSIVWLDREKPGWQVESFLKSNGIILHLPHTTELEDDSHSNLNVFKWKCFRALELVIDLRNLPILIVDPSGMTVGLLRKLMNWSFSSILSEFRRMTENCSYDIESYLETGELKLIEPNSKVEENIESDQTITNQSQIDGESVQSPSSSPQIPKSLLKRVKKRKIVDLKNASHVTLPPDEFLLYVD